MEKRLSATLNKIEQNGKSIFFADYRGLAGEQLANAVSENVDISVRLAQNGDRAQLRLTDVTDCIPSPIVMDALKAGAKRLKPFVAASAVVGITGARRNLLLMVNKLTGLGARPFSSVAEAKDWLLKQG